LDVLKTKNSMQHITIYHNNRTITLWEKTEELEIKVENLEIDEPFLHKCNDRMKNILDVFFKNENMQEISFEHYSLEKLLTDFISYFKYIEAAGGIVKNSKNELLVIIRLGVPDLPKGKIEKGEVPKIAAIREVEEECGISGLKIIDELKPSYHIYYYKNKKVLKKTFWFKMLYFGNEIPRPQIEEDISEVEWCNVSKKEIYIEKTYDSLKSYFKID